MYDWKHSFYLQASALIPCFLAFLVFPSRYLDIEGTLDFKKECLNNSIESLKFAIDNQDVDDSNEYAHHFENSTIEFNRENILKLKKMTIKILISNIKNSESKKGLLTDNQMTYKQKLKSIMANKVFLCLCGALTGVYYVITAI